MVAPTGITGTEDFLDFWVIYDHPKDFPNHFVVRCHRQFMGPGRRFSRPLPEAWLRQSLLEAREVIAANALGSVNIGRAREDDPAIVEVWL